MILVGFNKKVIIYVCLEKGLTSQVPVERERVSSIPSVYGILAARKTAT